MIKMIFFDLGWTLLKPNGAGWLCNPLLFRMFPALTPEDIKSPAWRATSATAYRPLADNPFMKDVDEQKTRFTAYYNTLLKETGLSSDPDDGRLLAEDLCENTSNMSLLDTSLLTLEALRSAGYRMAVISDTWPYIEKHLKDLGIESYFDHFTYSYRLGTVKPSPMMYQDALEACGFLPRECLFVDDRAENLEAAERFHINAVQITADPDCRIDHGFQSVRKPADLLNLL